jgi:hypothetical protein
MDLDEAAADDSTCVEAAPACVVFYKGALAATVKEELATVAKAEQAAGRGDSLHFFTSALPTGAEEAAEEEPEDGEMAEYFIPLLGIQEQVEKLAEGAHLMVVIDLEGAARFMCAKDQEAGAAEFVALYHKGGLEQQAIDMGALDMDEEDEEDEEEIDLGSEDSE